MNRCTVLRGGVAIAAMALVSCASEPPEPVALDSLLQLTATVEAIDVPARLVELRGENGVTSTVVVGPEVKNLAQVEVGDRVVVSYYEGLAAEVKKKGEGVEGVDQTTTTVEAPAGARPGRAAGTTVRTTVTIESVDTSFDTVTFRRADGMTRTLAVETPEGKRFIRELRPGDQVEVAYTEALAVSVQPAQ